MPATSTDFPSTLSMVAGQQDSFPTTSRKASNRRGLSISIPIDPVLTPLELNLGTPFIGNDLIRPYIWSPTSKRFSTLWSISLSCNSEAAPTISNANRSEDEDNEDDTQYITIYCDDPFYDLPLHYFYSEGHSETESDTETFSPLSLSFSCNALSDEEHGQAASELHEELARIAPGLDYSELDPDCFRAIESDLLLVSPMDLFEDVFLKSLKRSSFTELHPILVPENSSSEESDDDEFFDANEEPVTKKASNSSIR
ncbi:hypothetical protein MPER_08570, partial [Moniliophthora perniciosa FA553]